MQGYKDHKKTFCSFALPINNRISIQSQHCTVRAHVFLFIFYKNIYIIGIFIPKQKNLSTNCHFGFQIMSSNRIVGEMEKKIKEKEEKVRKKAEPKQKNKIYQRKKKARDNFNGKEEKEEALSSF